MITELLDVTIGELECTNFEITEFQLGNIPMAYFVEEVKSTIGFNVSTNLSKIYSYKGIRVSKHPSDDAIMYAITVKTLLA
jgi:hypothetical protein